MILIEKETTYFSKLVKPKKKNVLEYVRAILIIMKKEQRDRTVTLRRQRGGSFSVAYSLCINEVPDNVCRLFFVNTLGISEQMVKAALKKKSVWYGSCENGLKRSKR